MVIDFANDQKPNFTLTYRNNRFFNITQRSARLLSIEKPDMMDNIKIIYENNYYSNVLDRMGTGLVFITGVNVLVSNVTFVNSEVSKGLTL